jgi:uncharacterized membrane protein
MLLQRWDEWTAGEVIEEGIFGLMTSTSLLLSVVIGLGSIGVDYASVLSAEVALHLDLQMDLPRTALGLFDSQVGLVLAILMGACDCTVHICVFALAGDAFGAWAILAYLGHVIVIFVWLRCVSSDNGDNDGITVFFYIFNALKYSMMTHPIGEFEQEGWLRKKSLFWPKSVTLSSIMLVASLLGTPRHLVAGSFSGTSHFLAAALLLAGLWVLGLVAHALVVKLGKIEESRRSLYEQQRHTRNRRNNPKSEFESVLLF